MFDLVVLGGGSAGYAAARTAIGLGLQTAVIDGAPELGGLCILKGCMPSKAVIESANRARTMQRAAEFGLRCGPVEVRMQEVIERKRALVADFASYRREQLEDGRFALIRGQARYSGPNTLEVELMEGGTRRIETRTSLIATGSHVGRPSIPGLEAVGYWTSDDVLEAVELPRSVIVLGGGAIALEMAHYLAALGVKVTVLQRSGTLLSMADAEAGEAVREAFLKRGIAVECGTRIQSVEAAVGKRVRYVRDGVEHGVEADEILVALGRRPSIEALDLAAAGVEVAGGSVRTGLNQETSVPGIFAAGDVCGPFEVVHLAVEQGETAAWNAALRLGRVTGEPRVMDYRLQLFGVFCEPQVAMVGKRAADLIGTGRRVGLARHPFADHGKSMVQGETDGFVQLCADLETGEILSGLVVGPEAVELIHEIVVAMRFGATAEQLARLPHYHPSLAEIWTYPAEELAERVKGG
ncbi:MAG: FAD-dependent oxidoreductase [Verrucomicrobia bacterium]|nr:FAD-dependent oxidoreductase [Verrucomicrobiota bacterium]